MWVYSTMYNIKNCCKSQLYFKSQAIKILIAQSISRHPITMNTEITWDRNGNTLTFLLDISMPESFGCMTQTSTFWATEILRSNRITVVYGEKLLSRLQRWWNTVSLHLQTTTRVQNLSYSDFISIFDRFY